MQRRTTYALLGFLAVIVAAGIAGYRGMLPGTAPQAPEPVAASVPPATAPETPASNPQATPPAQSKAEVTVPSFDVLRVEPDGSVVVAGKAAPESSVDIVAGSTVVGTAKAAGNGDFAVALDKPLKPGDHQLVLRATGADNKAATSAQTAIVSVPEKSDGEVLALVEEPGQASRMITTPQAKAPEATPAPGAAIAAPATSQEQQKPAPIIVEAVEIEGDTVFVAGKGVPGKQVAVYANETLLGKAPVETTGRYLVERHHPLAVGDYIIRADLLEKDGTVIASARVPFHREAGENVSAVAPQAGASQPVATSQTAATRAARPLESVAGSVIIRKGDNLWTISKRTYGRGTRYTTIYLANADQIRNPDLIWPGQVFSMPNEPLPDDEAERLLKAKR
ncbi:peptidoglycan-binding protein LysM [Brucella endophytica]|uniref:Peptidoglycan-binding protein LysM n=1 Tax=Brucella endophytica TaxID=1963359 RepID=A0A916SCF0_9HYPH|nr:Ig-like domain-containing protein [Brucella endophytica]GGA92875.1 peptidoglycan-binding protein LysM [Brucella endophytica]